MKLMKVFESGELTEEAYDALVDMYEHKINNDIYISYTVEEVDESEWTDGGKRHYTLNEFFMDKGIKMGEEVLIGFSW